MSHVLQRPGSPLLVCHLYTNAACDLLGEKKKKKAKGFPDHQFPKNVSLGFFRRGDREFPV